MFVPLLPFLSVGLVPGQALADAPHAPRDGVATPRQTQDQIVKDAIGEEGAEAVTAEVVPEHNTYRGDELMIPSYHILHHVNQSRVYVVTVDLLKQLKNWCSIPRIRIADLNTERWLIF